MVAEWAIPPDGPLTALVEKTLHGMAIGAVEQHTESDRLEVAARGTRLRADRHHMALAAGVRPNKWNGSPVMVGRCQLDNFQARRGTDVDDPDGNRLEAVFHQPVQ